MKRDKPPRALREKSAHKMSTEALAETEVTRFLANGSTPEEIISKHLYDILEKKRRASLVQLPDTQLSPLSPEEQQRRREIIEQGITQVRLEGLELPAFYWDEAERYIRGELTLEQMRLRVLDHIRHDL